MHTVHAVHTAHTYCANHHAKKYAIMQHYNTLRFQYLPTSCDCSPWIYTLCLSLHIQYFSYVVDAPQHFHFNAWIKHDQTSSNPSDTLLHIMPFISIHYHLYSFIISSNSLINYGTRHCLSMFVCGSFFLLKVHRERNVHACVCVCTLAIKKWSRILLLLVWAFFLLTFWFLLPCLGTWYAHVLSRIIFICFILYVCVFGCVCVCLRACYKLGRYINECTDIHAFSQYD
jgi:hypothetical protein